MSRSLAPDCLLIGGGVIGLSLAWELARQGLRVQIVDQAETGQEASWAGAGILPPANRQTALHPYDQLRGLSMELHPQWAEALGALTGIDTGYRVSGGIYLARTAGETAALAGWAGTVEDEQIPIHKLSFSELAELEPGLAAPGQPYRAIYQLPTEAQLRNPRYLKALKRACELAGVEILPGFTVIAPLCEGDTLRAVETTGGVLSAGAFCFTAGAWTGRMLAEMGIPTGILPMRGQMLLFRCETAPFRSIVNEGPRYLVPRDDGHVLVGATEEEVGFDKRTTPEALRELHELACDIVPQLKLAVLERSWAGLRPASFDGFPYLGPLPGLRNAYVASGHFRSGLYLSPGTAVVMRQLICGQPPEIDLAPFRVGR